MTSEEKKLIVEFLKIRDKLYDIPDLDASFVRLIVELDSESDRVQEFIPFNTLE